MMVWYWGFRSGAGSSDVCEKGSITHLSGVVDGVWLGCRRGQTRRMWVVVRSSPGLVSCHRVNPPGAANTPSSVQD